MKNKKLIKIIGIALLSLVLLASPAIIFAITNSVNETGEYVGPGFVATYDEIVDYDKQPHSIKDIPHSIPVQSIVYSETKDGEYTEVKPEYTDAGTYTTYWKILRDDEVVKEGKSKLIINPRTAKLGWGETSWRNDGSKHQTTCVVTNLCEGDVCEVVLKNNSIGPGNGTVTVIAFKLSNPNYKLPTTTSETLSINGITIISKHKLKDGTFISSAICEAAEGPAYRIRDNYNIKRLYVGHYEVPEDAVTFDLSWAQNGDLVCWFEKDTGTIYITSISGRPIVANEDCSWMFMGLHALEEIDLSGLDVSNVTNMTYMIRECESLTNIDLSSWDTSNVKYMEGLFNDCSGLTKIDLSTFNTPKLEDTSNMFADCTNLKEVNLANFNTSKVSNMRDMFNGCTSLETLDLSMFSVKSTYDVRRMFSGCTNLKTIYASDWSDAKSVTYPGDVFLNCDNLTGAISFDSAKITWTYANTHDGYFTTKPNE